jgi:PPM family protein phosphatase
MVGRSVGSRRHRDTTGPPAPRRRQDLTYIAVTALSHDGLLRDHNEDSLLVGPWTTCAVSTASPQTLVFPLGADPVVVAVADGLGGHPAGELASTVVVESLARVAPLLGDEDTVRDAVRGCNQAVFDQASLDPSRTAMGTTLAGLAVSSAKVIVFNVGDSRVYAAPTSGLERVSKDDSPPLGPGQTSTAIVTQTLGGTAGLTPVDPHVVSHDLDLAARYLACTDGLTDVVDDSRIASILRDHSGAEAVYTLWKAAMDAGGPDNITLALVELAEPA